jgi:TatD DNase family protein
MKLVDTHCHIHSPEFFDSQAAEAALKDSVKAGVTKLLLVGTGLEDSKRAIAFANSHPEYCFASIGIHPHEAAKMTESEISQALTELALLVVEPKVVAVGECGFDFFYNSKTDCLAKQTQLLTGQLDIAAANNLPVSFHVREAFDEFWRVFEQYKNIRGVLHSFTDSKEHLKQALEHKLKIGVNGIATFTTKKWQIDLFKSLGLSDFVLETDSPFLTPSPKRGTINTPENVIYITNYMAELRGETKELIAKATTANAVELFGLT